MESRSAFIGHYAHGIDDKNRLFLPARFREKNKTSTFILTQGLEQCLFLFTPTGWEALAVKLDALPLANKKDERAFKRILLSGACEVEVDQQGRILMPPRLKDYAGIRWDAVIIGMLSHMEVWSKERWKAYEKKARQSFNKAAPHLAL